MCGIAGIYKFNGNLTVADVEAMLRMLDAQQHRGPDDWGMLLPASLLKHSQVKAITAEHGMDHISTYECGERGPAVILGSRRLSILDLSARGRMPMSGKTESGRTTWITHNGEIYNSPELRAELSAIGCRFSSSSDTEVLLHGFDRWGEGLVEQLRGMFAFAVFDTASARLTLMRDRFGIKPLYYSTISHGQSSNSNTFLFASEVRAIRRSNLIVADPEPEAAIRFLQLGSVPAPLTTIKNIFALPAGHLMAVGPDATSIRRYWSLADCQSQPAQRAKESSDRDHAYATRQLLDESVQQHLLSDVPLGIFLSGGIDSSALVALAAGFRSEPLTTLSIVFDEPEYDESKYARLIAEKYQTSHCETRLTSDELQSGLPDVFAAMDQPTVDGVNSFFVSRAAKRAGLKVVLSGLGGDEVFLGYSHLHKAASFAGSHRFLKTMPAAARRGLVRLAIPAGVAAGRSGMEKLSYLEEPSNTNMYLLFRGLFVPGQIQALLGLSETEMKTYGVPLPGINISKDGTLNGSRADSTNGSTSLLDSFVINDFQHYLQNQLLKDTDCMSMAHSIETRVPFLDHKLVEYVFGLPSDSKLNDEKNKPLLIKALGENLPREIWDRPKMGFTFPFASWLRAGNGKSQASHSASGMFDHREVEKVWTGFREKRFHWSRPWALMVLDQFR